ncbi:MAG: hypothetical protein H0X30_00495 [Anaerolineae bacterium]|nr:hypothetical protein [Anaerolineae bacterium]
MSIYTLPQPVLDSPLKIGLISADGRYGLPNSLREALLQIKLGEASLLLDALLLCGYTPNKRFTFRKVFDKLRETGFKLATGLVRRALNSGIFKLIALMNRRAGRPEIQYVMPAIEVLVGQYAQGKMVASDQLETADIQSLRLYRQGLHREMIRRAPGIYSRRFLAQRLGIGKRTTHNYDLRVGIRAIRRLSKQNLRHYPDWRKLIQSGKRGLNWLLIQWDDGRYFDGPLRAGIADNFMWKEGVNVYFVTQLCNRYVYAPDDNWADFLFLRHTDDERAFAHSYDPYGFHKNRMPTDPVSATLMVDRKAYKPTSDPIPDWLPPEMAARRISTNPFAAPR